MKKIIQISIFLYIICILPQLSSAAVDGTFTPGAALTAGQTIPSGNNASIQVQDSGLSKSVGDSISIDTNKTYTTTSGGCKIPQDIGSLFDYALCTLDSSVIPFLIGLGLVLFLAGVVKFVSSGDNEEARQGGRNMMLFGIVSLFIMVSIWGFVNILSRTFFGKDSQIQSLPEKSKTLFKQF
ncbi:MAG: hypothetical protein V4469_02900 [Patescibacteria group bacterium]